MVICFTHFSDATSIHQQSKTMLRAAQDSHSSTQGFRPKTNGCRVRGLGNRAVGAAIVISVLEVENPGVLDTVFADLPMYQSMGDQITTEFTPLRPYEDFATDICKRVGGNESYGAITPVERKGLFYLITFSVEYNGKGPTRTRANLE